MNSIRVFIYRVVPKSWRKSLGNAKLLKPLRDTFFRNKTGYRETKVAISKMYGVYTVAFQFVSSIQIATKAKKRGIETKLLRNTIQLLRDKKNSKQDNYVIADVGTNFGFLSLVWAKSVCSSGAVYSFEPHPNLYATFCKSVAINNLEPVITSNNVAVGSMPGTITISLANTTSNANKAEVAPKQFKAQQEVKMISIDTYFKDFERLDLIKIDVDGIELEILKGAQTILQRLKPIFVVETNGDPNIYHFFEKQNYEMLDMNLQPFSIQNELPLNIFCIPK